MLTPLPPVSHSTLTQPHNPYTPAPFKHSVFPHSLSLPISLYIYTPTISLLHQLPKQRRDGLDSKVTFSVSLAKTSEKSRLTLKKKNNKRPIPDSGAAMALFMPLLASLHPSSGLQVEHPVGGGEETARKVQTPESCPLPPRIPGLLVKARNG